jgi:hypothetical protein
MLDASTGEAYNLGEAAHIVAAHRQGPRGREPISDEDRDKRASNRVLLCATHHTLVDKLPLVYTVNVLRQMKLDHLASREMEHQDSVVAAVEASEPERLQSSLLPVVGLPVVIESASLLDPSVSESEIARQLIYPKGSRGIAYPFILRDSRLWTFSHLRQRDHPFGPLLDCDVEAVRLPDLASTEEGHRRVVALLNRALGRHLSMRGIRFDKEHQRYWLMPDRDRISREISERSYRYETKTGRMVTHHAVHHARRRTREFKDEWYHEAARLRFERFGDSWFLAVRPEFHLTIDGDTPMQAHRIGRKITRKKSHLYNDGYLDRLWFWKYFLSDGGPRLAIKVGEQSILVDSVYGTTNVSWPGVPGDSLNLRVERAAETLFSFDDFSDEDVDEEWWDDDEDDDEDDD